MAKSPNYQRWAAAIQTQCKLAIRREAIAAELRALTELGRTTLRDTDLATALQTGLATTLLRPDAVHFNFRFIFASHPMKAQLIL